LLDDILLDFEHVYRGLAQIDPVQECVIRLKHFEHLTFEEIATRLGGNSNTAKTHYYRGLVRLRELLGRTFEESFA
jgi:DNA-directed RNA polymerase specialized sigma24 family protein